MQLDPFSYFLPALFFFACMQRFSHFYCSLFYPYINWIFDLLNTRWSDVEQHKLQINPQIGQYQIHFSHYDYILLSNLQKIFIVFDFFFRKKTFITSFIITLQICINWRSLWKVFKGSELWCFWWSNWTPTEERSVSLLLAWPDDSLPGTVDVAV